MKKTSSSKPNELVTLGDGINGLWSLEDGTVDLILCDPPSSETQAKFDVKLDLQSFWNAAWGSLKPSGTVVLLASSLRFASEIIGMSVYFRYDLIWSKSVATGFLNAKERPLRAHEFILVFHRPRKSAFNGPAYHPQMVEGASPIHAARRLSTGENYGEVAPSRSRAGATDRWPTSVMEFGCVGTSDKKRIHPQQKPEAMLRWLVRTYSNLDDLVVDPFAGSGSTGNAAIAEGRRFLGWDSDPRFGCPKRQRGKS